MENTDSLPIQMKKYAGGLAVILSEERDEAFQNADFRKGVRELNQLYGSEEFERLSQAFMKVGMMEKANEIFPESPSGFNVGVQNYIDARLGLDKVKLLDMYLNIGTVPETLKENLGMYLGMLHTQLQVLDMHIEDLDTAYAAQN